jgi:MFS family permease
MKPKMSAPLRKLLIAQIPADFADWLDFVAIGALLAFVWQVDPFVFAMLAVSFGLPYLVVGPFAGVAVDRANINRVLILSNIGRAVMTAVLFFAPNWWILMIFIMLRGTVDTFYTPAKQAAIQSLAGEDTRMRANGISHAINQASKIAAPALGGALLIWLTPQSIFLVNALVSVAAAVILLRLPVIARKPSDASEPSIMQSLRDGLQEVRTSAILRPALIMMGAGYFAMFFYDTLIAPLTRELGFSQTTLGLSLAAVGAGGVLGAILLGLGTSQQRPFFLVAIGSGTGAVIVIAVGVIEAAGLLVDLWVFLGMFAILGFCSAMTVVPYRTVIQNNVSDARIGRVTALSEAINTVALLTAPFIGAAIASFLTYGAAFIAGGYVMIFVTIRGYQLRDLA